MPRADLSLSLFVSVTTAAAVKSEIFIGRVAHHLLLSKTFETDVLGPAQTSETWRSGLKATHATSLNRWRTSAVDAAVACLDPLFKTDPRLVEASQAYLWKREYPFLLSYLVFACA